MAIINMGQLGEPHESDITTALRDTKTAVDIGTSIHGAAMASKGAGTAAKNAETAATNAATRQDELAQSIATSDIRKAEMNIKNVNETHKKFSKYWNSLDDNAKKMYQTSDVYKEQVKFFKGFKDIAPGLVDDQGNIIATSSKTLRADEFKEAVAKSKMNIAEGNGTQEDANIIRLDKAAGADAVADVLEDLEDAIDRGKVDKNNPVRVAEYMQGLWKLYNNQKQLMRKQQSLKAQGNVNSGGLAPANANQDDPLGILGR